MLTSRPQQLGGRRGERGQVAVIFGLLLPVLFGLGAIVIAVGNWFTHAKHLQTKADAGALAAGTVWGFPCGPDIDAKIETEARTYVGPHTKADGNAYAGTTYNAQIGGVSEAKIHAVLNGVDWYDDDSNPAQADKTSPANPSYCDSKMLDVKVTEDNSFPLFSLLPLFPDIKRKARVEIQEVFDVEGVLPVSVRIPKPLSAAAVFYDENTGNIVSARYFCENAAAVPAGLGLRGWTTYAPSDPSGDCSNWANVTLTPTTSKTGVVVATSFFPRCDPDAPEPIVDNCLDLTGSPPFATVNDFCRQETGAVQCFFATGSGSTQTVQSGLQFIRRYATGTVTDGAPALRSVWLEPGGCTGGVSGNGYFSSAVGNCSVALNANVDLGTGRLTDDAQVTYKIAYGTGNANDICNFGDACALTFDGTTGQWSTSATVTPANSRFAFAVRVRLQNTTVNGTACGATFGTTCQWFYTGSGTLPSAPTNADIYAAPLQRTFMGNDDRSGPIEYLSISTDEDCDNDLDADPGNDGLPDYVDAEAASMPVGTHCFYIDMGLKGGTAVDQDEPPIAFNLTGTAQSALVDCDPSINNLRDEINSGCSIRYATNRFNTDPLCPPANQFFTTPKPAPFDDWPPFRCVLTQTTASATPGQLIQGLNIRFFNQQTNPACPAEKGTAPEWTAGRNYWHEANNPSGGKYAFAEQIPTKVRGNNLNQTQDKRIVTLFMTTYDSFGGSGNDTFPIVAFGSFYITGYGQVSASGTLTIDDPCSQGDSNTSPGAGRKPPPDLPPTNGAYIWGHFIDYVSNRLDSNPSGSLCQPLISFMPCIAVLVE